MHLVVSYMLSISLLSVLVAMGHSLPNGTIEASDYSRILVIPDVHGDDQMFLKSLYLGLQIVNDSEVISFGKFSAFFDDALMSGGPVIHDPLYSRTDTVLVQMGDLLHRGPFGKRCIQILGLVERVIGWHTLSLYGNHDIMASGPFFRNYWNPADDFLWSDIADGGPLWETLTSQSLLMLRLNPREGIDYRHPKSPATLFVHAGVELKWLNLVKLDRVAGESVTDHINGINAMAQLWAQMHPQSALEDLFAIDISPVTTRAVSDGIPAVECAKLEKVLEHFQVARIVVGHTPQRSLTVETLCDGKFILTDVYMSRWMQFPHSHEMWEGRPGAFLMNIGSDGLLLSMDDLSIVQDGSGIEFISTPVRFTGEAVVGNTPIPVFAGAPCLECDEVLEAPSSFNKRQRVGDIDPHDPDIDVDGDGWFTFGSSAGVHNGSNVLDFTPDELKVIFR